MTYSSRETIDTYEPRFIDIQPLDRRAIYHRGDYRQCTGFSEYVHTHLCVAMSSYCSRDSYTNPWRFAGQTSYIWPADLSKEEVMNWREEHKGTDIFNSTKIFQIKFWKPKTINPLNNPMVPNIAVPNVMVPNAAVPNTVNPLRNNMHLPSQQMGGFAPPTNRQMQIICPPGVGPGQQIQVRAPNGQLILVTVPNGIGPGQAFIVSL